MAAESADTWSSYVGKYAVGTAELVGLGGAAGLGYGIFKGHAGSALKNCVATGALVAGVSSLGLAKDFYDSTTSLISGRISHVERLSAERAKQSETLRRL